MKVLRKCRSHPLTIHLFWEELLWEKFARGTIREGQNIVLMQADGSIKKSKVKELYVFESLGKKKTTEVVCGDICAVVGLDNFNIGDTICDPETPEALPLISVSA